MVLSRRAGEQILIGNDIRVTVVSVKGNRVTLGIDAPKNVRIERSEIARVMSQATSSCVVIEGAGEDSLAASVAS